MSESMPRRTAGDWVALLASKRATADDLRDLKAWLAVDPLHWREFDEARRLWAGLSTFEAPMMKSLPRRHPVVLKAGLVAAAACAFIAIFAWRSVSHDFTSPVGEVRELQLADGSRLWLDSGAAVDFQQDGTRRTLNVARGRIHVEVAEHEAPFIVAANDAIIRDIGTAFTVDVTETELNVAVTDGIVEVDTRGLLTTLEAGSNAALVDGRSAVLSSFDSKAEAAWRQGRIVFDRTTLAQALREVERYRPGRIVLFDDAAATRVVSGALAIADVDGGLDSLAHAEGLRVLRLPGLAIVIDTQ